MMANGRGRYRATSLTTRMAVPRVPYKAPGSQSYEFIDIFNRLYRDRILFVSQDIDDEFANQMIAILLFLDQEDATAPVTMYFNTPGGFTNAGMAVYDCMMAMKYPIVTLNLGLAASMGAFLCGAGTKGQRMALPNSRFLIQAPGLPDLTRGVASEVALEVYEVLRQRDRIIEGFHRMTGRPIEQLRKDFNRDLYLTAYEAREYGLIDSILQPKVRGPSRQFTAGLGTPSV